MIKTVYHLSDIHIRNYKRHFEYRSVFYDTFKYLSTNSNDSSIIVVTGDIVHSKTDLSPESVQLMGEFFRGLANIMPTYVICGNHDANLANTNRLDSISPVVDQLNHPNLTYWKDTGGYVVDNLLFSVMSVFDTPDTYLKAKELKSKFDDKVNIALYHGVVSGAKTDLGFVLDRSDVNLGLFRGYDMVMLGDVHKTQFLDKNRTVGYPGSLIQQDFGESLHHGLLKWDIPTKSAEFIEIDNAFGYFTVEVEEGHITNSEWKMQIPNKARVRFELDEYTTSDQLSGIIEKVSNHTHMINHTVVSKNEQKISTFNKKLNYNNINDPEYQNYLIDKYASKQLGCDKDMINSIKEINRDTNKLVPDDAQEDLLGVVWKPIKFEFSNMFTYGEDNVLDMSNMSGLLGIFAKNAYGKSSIFSSLVYCMFDKCSRTSKASDVINNKSDHFTCHLEFSLDGKSYHVERRGRRLKSGNVKVDVDFYFLDSLKNKVFLNGKQRSETNKIIREYIGEYDDFILTSMLLQDDFSDFIRSTQKNRKTTLSRFSNLGVFEKLYGIASAQIKESSITIKSLEKKNLEDAKVASSEKIVELRERLEQLNSYKKDLKESLLEVSSELDEHNSMYNPIEMSYKSATDLLDLKNKLSTQIENILISLANQKEEYERKKRRLSSQVEQLSSVDISEVHRLSNEISSKKSEINEVNNKINLIKLNLNNIDSKLDKLKTHEYDPDCDYCVQNPFVRDANKALSKRPKIESELNTLQGTRKSLRSALIALEKSFNDVSWALDLSSATNLLEMEVKSDKSRVESLESKLIVAEDRARTVDAAIQDMKQYEDIIAQNEVILKNIEKVKAKKNNIQSKIDQVDINILNTSNLLSVQEERYSRYVEDLDELRGLNERFLAYKNYLEVVKYDGLPTFLIGELLPVLEKEVNSILSTMVQFTLSFELDSSKNVRCYVSYGDNSRWSIEMGSGMEKFVSSLAIRVALIKNSNIPRPNFLGVDEGFGSLDSENVASIGRLFDFLRTQFDFILCISHVTDMRDMVDGFLDIHRSGLKSKINYLG